jgi:hypothetical protein
MMISLKRLSELLAPLGFRPGWRSSVEKRISFVRDSFHPDLCEVIDMHCGGKRGEAVPAEVIVSLTRHKPSLKQLGEGKLLLELASDQSRGHTVLRSQSEAKEWERRLATVAPTRAAEWAKEVGPKILERTEDARRAVAQYLSLIPPDAIDSPAWLDRVEQPTRREVDRIAGWPGVLSARDADWAYELAAFALLKFGEQVEGVSNRFWGKNPLMDEAMMWRLVLIGDRLLSQHAEHASARES